MSVCTQHTKPIYRMAIMPKMAKNVVHSTAPIGAMGRANRNTPYVPNFSRTPAKITLPPVGAWSCASGSQACVGKNGVLIAKPLIKPTNTQNCSLSLSCVDENFTKSAIANVHVPVLSKWRTATKMTEAKVNTLPKNVKMKNLIAAGPRIGPPQILIKKNMGISVNSYPT